MAQPTLAGNIAQKTTGGPSGLSRRQIVLLARAEAETESADFG